MTLLLLGLLLFVGGHLIFAIKREWRDGLVSRLGKLPYMAAYSIVALAGLILIGRGWSSASAESLYVLPQIFRSIALVLMFPALVFLAAAYAPAGRIATAVKHPMLLATKVWASAHLLANGEVRSVLLFGGFLAFAVIDRIALKRRGDHGRVGASAAGDIIAVGGGLAAYSAIFLWLHPYLGGVAIR